MKHLAALALLPMIASPIAAQNGAAMTYDQRITCGALLFMSSQEAEDPSTEQQFAAHHISKAIEMSGKQQDEVVTETESKMAELAPAWAREDAALMETYSNCILTVINEFSG